MCGCVVADRGICDGVVYVADCVDVDGGVGDDVVDVGGRVSVGACARCGVVAVLGCDDGDVGVVVVCVADAGGCVGGCCMCVRVDTCGYDDGVRCRGVCVDIGVGVVVGTDSVVVMLCYEGAGCGGDAVGTSDVVVVVEIVGVGVVGGYGCCGCGYAVYYGVCVHVGGGGYGGCCGVTVDDTGTCVCVCVLCWCLSCCRCCCCWRWCRWCSC